MREQRKGKKCSLLIGIISILCFRVRLSLPVSSAHGLNREKAEWVIAFVVECGLGILPVSCFFCSKLENYTKKKTWMKESRAFPWRYGKFGIQRCMRYVCANVEKFWKKYPHFPWEWIVQSSRETGPNSVCNWKPIFEYICFRFVVNGQSEWAREWRFCVFNSYVSHWLFIRFQHHLSWFCSGNTEVRTRPPHKQPNEYKFLIWHLHSIKAVHRRFRTKVDFKRKAIHCRPLVECYQHRH